MLKCISDLVSTGCYFTLQYYFVDGQKEYVLNCILPEQQKIRNTKTGLLISLAILPVVPENLLKTIGSNMPKTAKVMPSPTFTAFYASTTVHYHRKEEWVLILCYIYFKSI